MPEGTVRGFALPEGHAVLHGRVAGGQPIIHYVAAGWTSADVRDAEAWWAELDARARRLAHPVKATIAP